MAKVHHICHRPVDVFNVEMQLQRDTDDGWKDMGEPRVNTKVPPVGKQRMTVVEYPGCITGTWRAKVSVIMDEDETDDHHELFETFSAPNHVPCRE